MTAKNTGKAWRLLGQLFSRVGGFSRSMGRTFGVLRDLWPTLGYRDVADVEVFLSFYDRGDIAAQLIDLKPDTCWRFPGADQEQPVPADPGDSMLRSRWLTLLLTASMLSACAGRTPPITPSPPSIWCFFRITVAYWPVFARMTNASPRERA